MLTSLKLILCALAPFLLCACSSEKTPQASHDIPIPVPAPDASDAASESETGADDGGGAPDASPEAAPPAIAITPPSARVTAGRGQAFVASSAVSWSVQEASGGVIDATGLYVAPDAPGTYHIVATHEDQKASAEVVVVPPGLDLVAGSLGAQGSADGGGANARFYTLTGVWSDSGGKLYLLDRGNQTIRRMDLATAQVTTLAGSAFAARLGGATCVDGIGADARFSDPEGHPR